MEGRRIIRPKENDTVSIEGEAAMFAIAYVVTGLGRGSPNDR
jgi:hypothetical protein